MAVCSTSNERAVSTIVRVLLGPEVEAKMRVFAGDIVEKKKPSPDIYNLAASELKVDPARLASRHLSMTVQRSHRGCLAHAWAPAVVMHSAGLAWWWTQHLW